MTRRERYVVVICGVIATLFILVRFVALPRWNEFSRSMSDRVRLDEQRGQYARILAEAGSVEQRLDRVQSGLAGLQKRFLAEKDGSKAAVSLLGHAEELAAGAGVAVQSKDILGATERRGLPWVSVSLTVECSPAQLTRFLYSIGHDELCLTLDALEVHRTEGTTVLRCRVDISSAFPLAAGGEKQ